MSEGLNVSAQFGEIRSAVHEALVVPARLDMVVWLVLSASDREGAWRYASEILGRQHVGHVNLGGLLDWMVMGEAVLLARVEQHKAHGALSVLDVREWLCGLAWLVVMAKGDCEQIMSEGFQSNWLCRSPEGETRWFAIGLDDSRSRVLSQERQLTLLRPWLYLDDGEVSEARYYRVCCLGRREQWPGLPLHLGHRHEWKDCWPHHCSA